MNKLFPTEWIVPVLVLLWGALGFYGGYQYSDNAWQARQAQQLRAQTQALEAEQLRSQAAARQSIQEQQALQKSYSVLKEKFDAYAITNRGSLVVWRDGVRAACATGVVPGGAVAPERQSEAQGDSGPSAVPDDAGAAISLSAGAVWMWNSALTGIDTPMGACGAADPANPACAADAGVGIEAAWENHTENAQICASNRLRYQRLINYIAAAQGTP